MSFFELENYFETVLKENGKHFNALLGLAKYKELQGDHSGAIHILNPLIMQYSKISIPLVEKMNNLLAFKEWDQVVEIANRILCLEPSNIEAFKLNAVVVICRDGNFNEATKHIQTFFKSITLANPKNTELFIKNIQLFSRIVVKNQNILTELFSFTEKMVQQNPGKPMLMTEFGHLCARMRKYKDAEHWYRGTLRLEDSCYPALMGLAYCQLQDTSAVAQDLTKQQINFLIEMQPSDILEPELLLMSANFCHNDSKSAFEYLDKAASSLIKSCAGHFFGCEYLRKLNPDLCIDIIHEYLLHIPNYNYSKSINIDKISCVKLLEMIIEACPGFGDALLLMAKMKMQFGDLDGALSALKKLLDSVDRTNAAGYLLMARILVKQGNYESASQSLEVGLTYNFKIRDDPLYNMIIGIVEKESGNLEGAINNLETAMSFAGLRSGHENIGRITMSDKATLYMEMISAYSGLCKFEEAMALMEDARMQFASTPEQSRIIIGNADLCLLMGEPTRAMEMLASVTPGETYYVQAHTKLADIYLNQRRDRHSFAQCYRDVVEHCPGAETYDMLGDAYMEILDPDRAIEAYKIAMKDRINDKSLTRKMGIALIKTHYYAKAIDYYKKMIKVDDLKELKLDMAELLMKLKRYDEAEEPLVEELNENRGMNDIQTLEVREKQLLLLAEIRERAGNIKGALTTLREAKENQARYVQRATMLPNILDHKTVLADICFKIAEHSSSIKDFNQAFVHYKEVLSYKPNDIGALLCLAKLHMQMNEFDKCTQCCQILLNTDPKNEVACVMMADLSFRKVDFDTAAFHFRQLLLQKPTYWTALARLIEVSRRTGNIDNLDEWILRAKNAMGSARAEAGFYYCSGLLDWRTGKLSSALRNFNAARRDSEWGQQSIYNMIEICLDPNDNMTLSTEVFVDDNINTEDSKTLALRNAQKLLHELNPKGNAQEMLTHRLLSNFYLLATKEKHNIEQALQDCTILASQETLRDHVGPALGLATAHILLKQTPRARNYLKRVNKNTWTFEDAEYLERCWLLLAHIYVQSSKYDLASELVKRVLQHNAACVRAHEISGYIAEKESNYREAASRYAKAWKFGGKCKLDIGYKLAYCFLKSKQYAYAIEICMDILKINPDYPRIRKDILDKSINNLRT